MTTGDRPTLTDLERHAAELMRELRATYADIDRIRSSAPAEYLTASTHPTKGAKPIREFVLDVLEDLGWPAYTREVSLYLAATVDRQIPPTRFGSLSADERKAFERGSATRPVWLCHGLTWNRGEGIKRLWARSDWPLAQRIVAPTTGRVQHLKITARLCDLALAAEQRREPEEQIERLRFLVADHARDVPGVAFKRGEFPLKAWRDVALDRLAELEPADAEARATAAEHLASRLSEPYLLFGSPDVIEGLIDDRREAAAR